jgi:hypothetical protein
MTAFAHLSGGFGSLPAPGVVCPCAYRTKAAGSDLGNTAPMIAALYCIACTIMRARRLGARCNSAESPLTSRSRQFRAIFSIEKDS